MNELLSDRIRWLMQQRNLTNGELAKIAGVKPASVSGWINGSSKSLKSSVALKISKECKVSLSWLVNGIGVPDDDAAPFMPSHTNPPRRELIPQEALYLNGLVQFRTDGDGGSMSYTEEEIRALNGSSLDACHLIRVWDSSMEPVLYKGDFVLVDTGSTELKDQGVFLIEINGALYIRLLQLRLYGGVVIKAFNPSIDPEKLEKDQLPDMTIVGKVIEKRGYGGLV